MPKDKYISIVQLIKSGKISIAYEISNIKSGKDISINIKSYLNKNNYFNDLEDHINDVKVQLLNTNDISEKQHLDKKIVHLNMVKLDFICDTLYLAEMFAKISHRTPKLKKAIRLFEEGNIREADRILSEKGLLKDQFDLIAFIEFQEMKIKNIKNGN